MACYLPNTEQSSSQDTIAKQETDEQKMASIHEA